jgi:hypothetical protein
MRVRHVEERREGKVTLISNDHIMCFQKCEDTLDEKRRRFFCLDIVALRVSEAEKLAQSDGNHRFTWGGSG